MQEKSASQYLLYSQFNDCIWRTALLDGLKIPFSRAVMASEGKHKTDESVDFVLELNRIVLGWKLLYDCCTAPLNGSIWLGYLDPDQKCTDLIGKRAYRTVDDSIDIWSILWPVSKVNAFIAANHVLIYNDIGLWKPPSKQVDETINAIESGLVAKEWIIANCLIKVPHFESENR